MTVNKTNYYNWQKGTKLDKARFGGKASPNVTAWKDYLLKRYAGTSVGIVNKREVRGGGALSTHYFGAAIDWRYPTRVAGKLAMKELVNNSKEYGIQMIVDYVGCVIWTPSKGWHKATPDAHGMGQSWAAWLHIETTKTDWGNKKRVEDRIQS
ncbi:hypothetical protein UFOVP923_12 [uncultured Caudovirales phage]|uniref:Uncharacterized protein n=1 Tax=uncultured Caudovirales phage TaxID=2100421 RepID=A0A6J5PRF4_9CAUD|nr:hypothetical protein UFOVP923_12 [uncultured Caudovirales phage]